MPDNVLPNEALQYNDAATGEALKLAALRLLEIHRARVVLLARRALLTRLLENETATVDDVRRRVPLPAGVSPKVFGCVPGDLARLHIIERLEFQKTRRSVAHARPVSVWRLKDRDAALRWLADHAANSEPLSSCNESNLFAHCEGK